MRDFSLWGRLSLLLQCVLSHSHNGTFTQTSTVVSSSTNCSSLSFFFLSSSTRRMIYFFFFETENMIGKTTILNWTKTAAFTWIAYSSNWNRLSNSILIACHRLHSLLPKKKKSMSFFTHISWIYFNDDRWLSSIEDAKMSFFSFQSHVGNNNVQIFKKNEGREQTFQKESRIFVVLINILLFWLHSQLIELSFQKPR